MLDWAQDARGEGAMAGIDFFYFFGSGYAYLSVLRIGEMAAAGGGCRCAGGRSTCGP